MGGARWLLRLGLTATLTGLMLWPLEAQTGKLTGVVTDSETGAPLEGVRVLLRETGLSALTGPNGRYFILNAPVGRHIVLARGSGHQAAEIRNVTILIDLTRSLPIALAPSSPVVADGVWVPQVPLVETGATSSRTNLRAEGIVALPVTDIADLLSLQAGFFQLPPNTDIIAYADTRRLANLPVRVRGGRAGETLMLLDGFPVNDLVFGGPAFDISLEAVEQIDYQRGGFEAQYGNALSGIVHIATREGGTDLAGNLSYRTSAVGGALGSTPDELADFSLLEGRFSGPVPGTRNALRFMVAGRQQAGADRVLEFDDEINRPSMTQNLSPPPEWGDLIPGWRAFGYDNLRDLTAKLTYYVKPMMKLTGEYIGYLRQRLPYDFDYLLTGFDYLDTPGAGNRTDSLALAVEQSGFGYSYGYGYDDTWVRSGVVQGSIRARRDAILARWDHAISGRWSYQVQAGWLGQERQTCNVFQGICLGDHMAYTGRTASGFQIGFYDPWTGPTAGTDDFYDREQVDSYLSRIDVDAQVTDHHNVRFGVFYQKDHVEFTEFRDRGLGWFWVVPSMYAAQPWTGALYVQDRIEYDFATITLGLRYDVGRAAGVFFTNPFNPTNGTTAREICDGTVPGISDTPWTDGASSGFAACAEDETLRDSATALAQFDDFAESARRGALSPRVGVSIPVSDRAHVFFNLGRYTQHPLYNTAYQSSGIGTFAGDEGGNVCDESAVVPGTTQCLPLIQANFSPTPYVGNPTQGMETTTSYEVGVAAEVAPDVALQVVAFSKEQTRLSGLAQGGKTEQGDWAYDVGYTYPSWRSDSLLGAYYDYTIVANLDYQAVRGIEISLRRRGSDHWGAWVNYTLSQTTTTAAAPDLEFQQQEEEGEPANLRDIPSEIDRPHVLNAAVFFWMDNENPFGRPVLDAIIRNTQLSFTLQAASGIPFTPTLSFYGGSGNRAPQNSGRGPATMRIDAFAAKDFELTDLRVGIFLQVLNLFDQRVCQQVFASTGYCDAGTVDQRRAPRRGWGYVPPVESTFFDRPHYTGARRSINVGVRMGF